MDDTVLVGDVTEAMRLIACSKSSITERGEAVATSKVDKIYNLIHEIVTATKKREVAMADAIDRCVTMGYTNDEIEEAIEEFEANNMWHVNADRTKIIFV